MKKKLNIKALQKEAKEFCNKYSGVYIPELFGVTDGKAVGTFVEHLFQKSLSERYDIIPGNSASGLDLPSVNTDIKVTSIRQPQSSCPFRDSKQKIYGLGYHLLLFVYKKEDDVLNRTGMLDLDHNIPADETTLYRIAKELLDNPPEIGFLTISNALQWRLQYGRIVSMSEDVDGIARIVRTKDKQG